MHLRFRAEQQAWGHSFRRESLMPVWVQGGLILQSNSSWGQGSARSIRITSILVKHIDSWVSRPQEIEPPGIGPRSLYFQNHKNQTTKKKILKTTRGKHQITCKGLRIRLWAVFSAETLQARREWHDRFKVMKGINLQQRILYPARLLFRSDREIKNFTDYTRAKRIQHHQTSFTSNSEGILSAGNRREENKRWRE